MERNGDDIQEALLKGMESFEAFFQREKEKTEHHLWNDLEYPGSLHETLGRMTKENLNKIRKNLEIKNLSSLKKAELADKLAVLIPQNYRRIISLLDQTFYKTIKKIVKNSGIYTYDFSSHTAELLMKYGICFPCLYKGRKALFMPPELIDAFQKSDGHELEKTARRNSEWIRLTQGLLYYYGVISTRMILEKIRELTRTDFNEPDFFNVIDFAVKLYRVVEYSPYGMKYIMVDEDEDEILQERKKRPDIDYFPFTRQQLTKAGDPDFIEITPELNNLMGFLLRHYEIPDEAADDIRGDIVFFIIGGEKPAEVLEYLEEYLESPSKSFLDKLLLLLTEVYNHTRQWALKGHSPAELAGKDTQAAKPARHEEGAANIIDLKRYTKVGRNDPCPCGSGKKYKYCCGRIKR